MKVKYLTPKAKLLEPAKPGDAGYDITAPMSGAFKAGCRAQIPTGICVEIPEGYVGIVKEKSGLALNKAIQVMGGVIDSGFRGEIELILYNANTFTNDDIEFEQGDKLAQLLILPISTPKLEVVDELSQTVRADTGFGSSGK